MDYDEKVYLLERDVDNLISKNQYKMKVINNSDSLNLNSSKIKIYYLGVIPVIIFVVLIFLKPKIIQDKYINDKNHFEEYKINYKKLLFLDLILSVILIIAIIKIYNHFFDK